MKNPKKYFEGFLSGASRISRVWGRHSPTRFPQGQNERKANFGTAVESCSKKLPDCRSLPTATFSENRNQLFHKSCWIALTCYCHFFGKSITSFFHKRRRAGILPLTPYKPQKSRMDGLSGKNFSGGSVFPDNKAFRKLRFARCLKKRQPFLASLSNTELLEICQKWVQKKQQIFFGFTASCAAAGRLDIQFLCYRLN